MKKFRILPIALLLTFRTLAQDSVSATYGMQLSEDRVKRNIEVLASDSLEGRETGKPGQKKAAAFIASQFKSAGLLPASHQTYLQHHTLSQRVSESLLSEVNQASFVYMKDFYYESGYRDTTITPDSIVFCGFGISDPRYNDFINRDVSGKTLLFFEGEPRKRQNEFVISKSNRSSVWSQHPDKKYEALRKQKPGLVLIIHEDIQSFIDSMLYKKPGHNPTPTPDTDFPIAHISMEMASRFFPEDRGDVLTKSRKRIERKGTPDTFSSSTSAKIRIVNNTERMKGQNVIGLIEGRDKKNEYLFITAHYDHLGVHDSLIYHGADDNASGVSAVIEMARIFTLASTQGHAPRRTLVFMTVSGEEKGLLGSDYYINHPIFPLSQTVADLNTDMIGRTDQKHDSLGITDYIYVIGSDKLSTDLHRISESANRQYTKLNLDYQFNQPDDPNRFYFRSDHYNFAKHNIPVIFYFNGIHSDYHKASDTAEKINSALLMKRLRLIFLTAWEVANREERIRVDVKNDMEKDRDSLK